MNRHCDDHRHKDSQHFELSLKDTLDEIAMGFKGYHHELDKEKLGEASEWKMLLKSHRNKMKDFDDNMKLCVSFYRYALHAGNVITITNFKLLAISGQLVGFRDQQQLAPVLLEHGESLELTISTLRREYFGTAEVQTRF